MTDSGAPEIVELPVDRARDPGGGRLASAINAHFGLEAAARRRRAWTAALALLGVPSALALVFPGILAPALRRAGAVVWSLAATALLANLVTEVRSARAISRLQRELGAPRGSRGANPRRQSVDSPSAG